MTLCCMPPHNKCMRNYEIVFREQIRKDKNGATKKWVSTNYYIRYYKKSRRYWVNTNTSNYDDAVEFAKKKMAELEKGTVYEFLKAENWLDPIRNPIYYHSRKGNITYTKVNYAHSSKNARYLQIVLEQLKDPIGDINFSDVTAKDAQEFKERLSDYKTYTDAHGKKREITTTFKLGTFSAFSVIWTYYIKTGKSNLKYNPFSMVGTFKKPEVQHKKYIFTPQDYRDLFNRNIYKGITPSSSYKSKHDGSLKPLTKEKWDEITQGMWCDFFELIFLSGLRGSEAAALRADSFPDEYEGYVLDVNWAIKSGLRKENINNEIKDVQVFGPPKTEEKRRIVLCDRAHDICQKYLRGKKGSDLLFTLPGKSGNKYSTLLLSQQRANAFRLFINEMNQYLNFVDEDSTDTLCLHGARTSLNTNLLGLRQHDEWLIAYYLGWKSESLTKTQEKHYTDYSIESLISVANSINKLYLGKEFTWTPKPQEVKKNTRQENIQILLAKAAKNNWVENFRSSLERFSELTGASSRVPEIEEFLSMPVEKAQRLKHIYYANLIHSALALNLRTSRMNLEEFLSSYDESWDKL